MYPLEQNSVVIALEYQQLAHFSDFICDFLGKNDVPFCCNSGNANGHLYHLLTLLFYTNLFQK